MAVSIVDNVETRIRVSNTLPLTAACPVVSNAVPSLLRFFGDAGVDTAPVLARFRPNSREILTYIQNQPFWMAGCHGSLTLPSFDSVRFLFSCGGSR
jgi:hypothetical protein